LTVLPAVRSVLSAHTTSTREHPPNGLCASDGNEKEVGEALREAMDAGIVKREELFITSKLWNTFHAKENVGPALAKTLADLKV